MESLGYLLQGFSAALSVHYLLYAFAGALLGGITSPLGAVVGGVLMGVIENIAGAYVVGTELKLTTALVIIVVVMTVLMKLADRFARPRT